MLLPITPDIFDRVQLGGAGRQPLQPDAPFQCGKKFFDQATPVRWQAVPDNEEFARQLPREMPQKINNLFSLDRAVVKSEVEVPESDPGNCREVVPVKVVLQDGSFSTRSPGPNPVRLLGEPAFVDKDYCAPFAARFFLMAGHCFFFQCAMACSSLSRARPTGRWELHPRPRRILQT
jgi:hypothetical protein